jgi:hypothetical protein
MVQRELKITITGRGKKFGEAKNVRFTFYLAVAS